MNLFDRAKNIIVAPNKEWLVIKSETPNTAKIITGYVVPLAGLAAIAAFIGYAFIGVNILGIRFKGIDLGLYYALSFFISAIISVFVCAFVIDMLAPTFASEKNLDRSVQLVAYSFTPAWVGGLLMIIPAIGWLGGLFGLYGLYLLYLGLPIIKNTPEEKKTTYFIISLIVFILVYIVVGWIMNMILSNIFSINRFNPNISI